MWQRMLVGAAMIAFAGASLGFAFAQAPSEEAQNKPPIASDQEPDALGERLSSFKERLRLTPEQEKYWMNYQSALRAVMQHRRERLEAMRQARPTDPTQGLRQRATVLGTMSAALSRLADAQEPLYNNLDEAQKHRFAEFRPMLRDDDRSARDREDGRRVGARDREGDDRDRRWRDRDHHMGWHHRHYGERRSRSRDYDDEDRRSWHSRKADDHCGWRGRDYDDDDRRGWHGRRDDDRRSWRGRDYDHDEYYRRHRRTDDDRRGRRGRDD